jgi:hypothetical protein
MAKKLPKDIREMIEGQIECEGFDYAFTQKISPEELPDEDVKRALNDYLAARENLKCALELKGVNVDSY